MSAADRAPDDRPPEDRPQERPQSSPAARRRARVLIPTGFVVAVLLVFLFIVLVSRCGSGGDDVYSGGPIAGPVADRVAAREILAR